MPNDKKSAAEIAISLLSNFCRQHHPKDKVSRFQSQCVTCINEALEAYATQEREEQKQREERLVEFVEYVKEAMHLAVSPELRIIAGQVLEGDYSWEDEAAISQQEGK